MRTRVAIIGGGPAGMLLSHRLRAAGVEAVVLERRPLQYVLSRIRAGVLEWGTVERLHAAGLGERMMADGLVHSGVGLGYGNSVFRVDFDATVGRRVMVYGQTEVTKDLYAAAEATGAPVYDEVDDVALHEICGKPFVTYTRYGQEQRLDCDFIAGCDGFHGVSRTSIPQSARREYERVYPFGWLGVLSQTPPASEELIYSNHTRGFALASMRSPTLSRYYIQVPVETDPDAWSDDAFWDELRRRLPAEVAQTLATGPSLEKSIAPLRSFACEPMRYGRLFLAGDAAHIVPPTGAKGLNLAFCDVHYLSEALIAAEAGDETGLEHYSERALSRVWKAIRFSWWLTALMHRFPDQTPFDQRVQESELATIASAPAAMAAFAEGYTGYPL